MNRRPLLRVKESRRGDPPLNGRMAPLKGATEVWTMFSKKSHLDLIKKARATKPIRLSYFVSKRRRISISLTLGLEHCVPPSISAPFGRHEHYGPWV
jgi:hypothetical protein